MISIIQTRPGDSQFHTFEKVRQNVYGTKNTQSSTEEALNMDFLVQGFVGFREERPVARVALYNNPDLRFRDGNAWCVGNYEATDDPEAATTLLAHGAACARFHGARYLLGPMNGSTWDSYRLCVDFQNPPFFLEPLHPAYYNDHFKNAGFEVIAKYHSNVATSFPQENTALLARKRHFEASGVRLRPIDLSHYDDELKRIHAFNAFAFTDNFLYTPIRLEAFLKKYEAAWRILQPQLTMMAEDREGNLIGYYFCYDDLLSPTKKTLVFKTLVRHPAAEWQGLGQVMGYVICQKAMNMSYERFIHPFIYDRGTSVSLSTHFEGTPYRTYALYGKEIS